MDNNYGLQHFVLLVGGGGWGFWDKSSLLLSLATENMMISEVQTIWDTIFLFHGLGDGAT